MATGQLNEQEIQFRKRARRRLIGAIALVLLMVTVLPMVLDEHEQKAPLPEIAISIPGQDSTGFTSKVVPVVAPSVPPTTAPSSPASASPASAKVQLSSPLEKQQAANGKNPASATSAVVTPSTSPAKVPEPSPAPVVEQQNSPAPIADTVQTAPAKPRQTAAVSKPEVKNGSFSVQIGVFTDAANVKQLQVKATAQGLQSYTETLATPKGPKIRLRAGPFASRDAAEKAQEKLKAVGLGGIVVLNK